MHPMRMSKVCKDFIPDVTCATHGGDFTNRLFSGILFQIPAIGITCFIPKT